MQSEYAQWYGKIRIMLVQLKERGWDIPGGHREPGETALQCAERETLEEGYVRMLQSRHKEGAGKFAGAFS